jgi:hypothetical protein
VLQAATVSINRAPFANIFLLDSSIKDRSQRLADTVAGYPLSILSSSSLLIARPGNKQGFRPAKETPPSRQRLCWTLSVADLALTVRVHHLYLSVLDEISKKIKPTPEVSAFYLRVAIDLEPPSSQTNTFHLNTGLTPCSPI